VPTGTGVFGQDTYTGVKVPGACNNDILVSISNNAGATFTGTTSDPRVEPVATTDSGQATTDQFWQWIAFTKNGKLATSYYDRQYGADETTGYSDVSLSSSGDYASWNVNRVTSASMPPPTQFAGQFYGDYSGLAAYTDEYPLWLDTMRSCSSARTPVRRRRLRRPAAAFTRRRRATWSRTTRTSTPLQSASRTASRSRSRKRKGPPIGRPLSLRGRKVRLTSSLRSTFRSRRTGRRFRSCASP
jgi:hypothetical protein